MRVLNHDRLHVLLEKLVAGATHEIILVSAFCTSEAVRRVLDHLRPNVRVSFVARWSKGDIAMGSSDLDVYEVVTERQGRVFRNPRLHAKLFMADKEQLLFGSANLTARGLGIAAGCSNIECMSNPMKVESEDIHFINSIIRESQVVNQELIDALKAELLVASTPDFDESELSIIAEKPAGIFVNDLPFTHHPNDLLTTPESQESLHDREVFMIDDMEANTESLKTQFELSHIMSWVDNLVSEPMSFGSFTSALHNSLIDDPRPYRKQVKALQNNLFAWIENLIADKYVIEVPSGSHSQIIRKK